MKKERELFIIVEDDGIFFPRLLIGLGKKKIVDKVFFLERKIPLKKKLKKLLYNLYLFGIWNSFQIAFSIVQQKLMLRLKGKKFTSVAICKKLDISFENISNLGEQSLTDYLKKNRDRVGLIQVSFLINKSFLKKGDFINKHCSILPHNKGVLPIYWGLVNNEINFGVTIHRINEKFDEGEIISQTQIAKNIDSTFFSLYMKLYDLSVELISDLLNDSKERNAELLAKEKGCYYSFPTITEIRKNREKVKFGKPILKDI